MGVDGSDISREIEALQHELQRKLGRCLLRVQQYELLMKSLLARYRFAGPAAEFEALRIARVGELAAKSLGQLVGELTGSVLAAEGVEATSVPSTEGQPGWMSIRHRIEMTEERYQETVVQLAEVVGLRNEMVHQLVERYDLWSDAGCLAASKHLDLSYARIDEAVVTLQQWAQSMSDAAAMSAAFLSSQAFEGWVMQDPGAARSPDNFRGSAFFDLLGARSAASADGWSSLNEAVTALSVEQPGRTPKSFGCATWRQLLHESGQFELQRERGSADGPGRTLYRLKPKA